MAKLPRSKYFYNDGTYFNHFIQIAIIIHSFSKDAQSDEARGEIFAAPDAVYRNPNMK